jgi:hypothetical protein
MEIRVRQDHAGFPNGSAEFDAHAVRTRSRGQIEFRPHQTAMRGGQISQSGRAFVNQGAIQIQPGSAAGHNNESYLLTGTQTNTPNPMRVSWIYARRDGSLSFDEPPAYSTTNPVIGRFAYWVDDESARVNLNTAGLRSPTNGAGNPANVELTALPGFSSDTVTALVNARTQAPFRTVGDAWRASPGAAAAIATNRFSVSAYNFAAGADQLVLTTQAGLAGGRPFLDILKTPNTDPGLRSNLDGSKLSAAVQAVYDRLARTTWPMLSGASFVTKYGSEQTWQIAARIVDFVRCAESTNTIVEPVLYRINGSTVNNDLVDTSMTPLSGQDGDFLSSGRAPLITEMGISYDPEDVSNAFGIPYWRIRYYIEVYLPPDYGIEQIDLLAPEPGKRLYVHISPVGGPFGATPSPESTSPMQFGDIWRNNNDPKAALSGESRGWATQHYHRVEAADIITLNGSGNPVRGNTVGGTTVLTPGRYLTIEKDFWVKINDAKNGVAMVTTENFQPGNKVFLSAGLGIAPDVGPGSGNTMPCIAMTPIVWASGANRRWLTLGPPGNLLPNLLAGAGARSLQIDDPRAGTVPADWKEAPPTFCLPNDVSTVGHAPLSVEPPQDTDADGDISDASLAQPARKGSAANPAGVLPSVAHLGWIPTGLSNRVGQASIPWRTLRFQPTKGQTAQNLPDWALCELFSVPAAPYAPTEALQPYFGPSGANGGGKVNLNTEVLPFGMERLDPLKAVFLNAPDDATNPNSRLSPAQVDAVAQNIVSFAKAQNGVLYGAPNLYESVGEVFEIKGVADRGEASEAVARQVANLLTTRGGVYSVHAVGQSLIQRPNGTLLITGAQRLQAHIERVETSGTVRFRPVYIKTAK